MYLVKFKHYTKEVLPEELIKILQEPANESYLVAIYALVDCTETLKTAYYKSAP